MKTSRRSLALLLGALVAGCTAPLILAEGAQDDVVPLIPESASDAAPQDITDAATRDSGGGNDDDGGFDGIQNVDDGSAGGDGSANKS